MAVQYTPRTARSVYPTSEEELEMSRPGYSLKRPVKTALHQAVLDCRIHQARLLVEKHGGNVDARDMFGRTPLMLACLLENEEYGYRMTRMFMKEGAFINMRDNMNRTALHYACMKGREAIVSRLLNEDTIDVSLADNDGNNAMMHAALCGKPQIVKVVLDVVQRFGLNVDERNGLGYTALLVACKFGHYTSAYILLTTGGSQPDLRDKECYLTAAEWVWKSSSMRNCFLPSRSQTMLDIPHHTLSFTREHTMYTDRERTLDVECRHAPKTAPNPLGRSLGSALHLPEIFKKFNVDRRPETHMEGRDAREMLLQEIDHVISHRKSALRRQQRSRTFHLPSGLGGSTLQRANAPSTAKLRSLQREPTTSGGSVAVVADLQMLFKLYSDQFESWRDTSATSLDASKNVHFDKLEGLDTVATNEVFVQ